MVAGIDTMELAKMIGITPDIFTLIGRLVLRPPANVTLVMFVAPWNALAPMEVTLLEIATEVIPVRPWNAPSPMAVTPTGMVTSPVLTTGQYRMVSLSLLVSIPSMEPNLLPPSSTLMVASLPMVSKSAKLIFSSLAGSVMAVRTLVSTKAPFFKKTYPHFLNILHRVSKKGKNTDRYL